MIVLLLSYETDKFPLTVYNDRMFMIIHPENSIIVTFLTKSPMATITVIETTCPKIKMNSAETMKLLTGSLAKRRRWRTPVYDRTICSSKAKERRQSSNLSQRLDPIPPGEILTKNKYISTPKLLTIRSMNVL